MLGPKMFFGAYKGETREREGRVGEREMQSKGE